MSASKQLAKKQVKGLAEDNWALGKPQSLFAVGYRRGSAVGKKECQATRVAMTDGWLVVDAADVVDDERGKKGTKVTSDAGLTRVENFSP